MLFLNVNEFLVFEKKRIVGASSGESIKAVMKVGSFILEKEFPDALSNGRDNFLFFIAIANFFNMANPWL
jgi:hypothetical protein